MAGNVQEKQLRWYNIALMSFITVWGFGNVVNNYANQGLVLVFSFPYLCSSMSREEPFLIWTLRVGPSS